VADRPYTQLGYGVSRDGYLDRPGTKRPARSPTRVTVTASGRLDPAGHSFTTAEAAKLVYCPRCTADTVRTRLEYSTTVVDLGGPLTMGEVSEDLSARGANRLTVEGGGTLRTQFRTADLTDELQLARYEVERLDP
jgi:5-amino-6-(5-phosphoribosylamino)uracil reductase